MEVSSHSGELPDLFKYDSLFRRAHRGVGGDSKEEKKTSEVNFGPSKDPIAGLWAASRMGSHLTAVGESGCGESALVRQVACAEVPVGAEIQLLVRLPAVRPEVESSNRGKGGTETLLELLCQDLNFVGAVCVAESGWAGNRWRFLHGSEAEVVGCVERPPEPRAGGVTLPRRVRLGGNWIAFGLRSGLGAVLTLKLLAKLEERYPLLP
jgi:hypothetical protein